MFVKTSKMTVIHKAWYVFMNINRYARSCKILVLIFTNNIACFKTCSIVIIIGLISTLVMSFFTVIVLTLIICKVTYPVLCGSNMCIFSTINPIFVFYLNFTVKVIQSTKEFVSSVCLSAN